MRRYNAGFIKFHEKVSVHTVRAVKNKVKLTIF